MIIPTEARATMVALRQGRTLAQFLDEMWSRRRAEKPPGRITSKGKWPFNRDAQTDTNNVTEIRPRKKRPA